MRAQRNIFDVCFTPTIRHAPLRSAAMRAMIYTYTIACAACCAKEAQRAQTVRVCVQTAPLRTWIMQVVVVCVVGVVRGDSSGGV